MKKKRKNYSPEEKVRLLKEHLVNGVAVSQICEENRLQPTIFYRWQRQFFEQGVAAFKKDQDGETTRLQKKIAKLEEKVAKKNEVLGELMEAHIALKKVLGKTEQAQGPEKDAPRRGQLRPILDTENAPIPSPNSGTAWHSAR